MRKKLCILKTDLVFCQNKAESEDIMLSEISQTQERKILCDVSFMVSLHFKNYKNKSAFKGWLGVRGTLVKRYKVVTCLDLDRSVVLALGRQRKKNQELGSFVCRVNVRPVWCTG